MEIEKKYRVSVLPTDYELYEKKEIEQGYLCTSPVVRIRKSNDDYYMTYKAPKGFFDGVIGDENLLVNTEVEVPLHKESYDHLKKKVDYNVITKTRYIIPLQDGHNAELDIFHGILEGLVFAEVEFESEEAAVNFKKPEWFLEDITKDKQYKNNYLTMVNDISEIKL